MGLASAQLTLGLNASSSLSLGLRANESVNAMPPWSSDDEDADACASVSVSLSDYFGASMILPDSNSDTPWGRETNYSQILMNVTLFDRCFASGPAKRALPASSKSPGPSERVRSIALNCAAAM